MADIKISELNALASTAIDVSADVFAVVDTSATQTKKLSVENVLAPIVINKASAIITNLGTVTTADINGGTWQGTIDGAWTASGVTCANLGTVSAATSITSTAFVGDITGDVTGTAAVATAVTVADESTDTTCFPLFATAATGNLPPKSGSNLTFNSNTGLLTSTLLAGGFDGIIGGNTPAAGTFTTIDVNSSPLSFSGAATIDTSGNNLLTLDGGTAGTAVKTKLSVSGAVTANATFEIAGARTASLAASHSIQIAGSEIAAANGDQLVGLDLARTLTNSGGYSTVDSIGVDINNPGGSGTVVDNYGIYIANQTRGTNDYGLYIAGADTYAIWVDAGASRFDGNVGITGNVAIGGTATPTSFMHIQNSSANSGVSGLVIEGAWPWMKLMDTESAQSTYGDYVDGGILFKKVLAYADRANAINTGTTLHQLDSSGNFKLNIGNLVIGTSGKGIDFGVTTPDGTSVSSEILDDYEEGTFTMGRANVDTNAIANGTGYYTKIGDLVYFHWYSGAMTLANSTGSAQLTGLPFTSASTGHRYGQFTTVHGTAIDGDSPGGYINLNATTAEFVDMNLTTGAAWINSGGNLYIMVQGFYHA